LSGIGKLTLSLQLGHLGLVIVIFLLAVALAVFTYRRTFPPLPGRKKALLLTLRILALFSLFLALSEPILGIAKRYVHPPVVALLLDHSKSMNLKGRDATRLEELKGLAANLTFDEIASRTKLEAFAFADSLVPLDSRGQLPDSLGNATSMGEAINSVVQKLKDENLAAIVIAGDGANNLGEDPVLAARSGGVPVYACGVGDYVQPRDLSVERITYPDVGYVGDQITVEVDVSQSGFDQTRVPVSIREKKTTLTQKDLTLGKSGGTQTVELTITPEEAGLHQYQLSLPVMDGESVKENNQRTFAIKVLKSKISLLLVSGSLNWEYTFLKRALDGDENVRLETVVYGKEQQPLAGRFPQGTQGLQPFDILLFVDPPRFILREHKTEINDFLSTQGGSVLFLLGKEFMDSQAFLEVGSILPFDPTGSTVTFSSASVNLELTEEGKLHPVTRLDDNLEENAKIWSDLPPFQGVVTLGPATKDATTLAQFENPLHSAYPAPAIAVRNQGKGKVLAITVTPFWRFDFLLWGIGKNDQAYRKFWNNCVRWLAVREDMDLVNVYTDKRIYMGGEGIQFAAKIFDQNYQKLSDASVVVTIKGQALPDSELVSLSLNQAGDYQAKLGALPPGDYSYAGQVFRDGEKIGAKKGQFLVEQYSVEDSDLKTDFDLLRRMAEASGGKYYQKEDIGNLSRDLNVSQKEEVRQREIRLWNSPLLLVIFVLCLSIEWAVRKRSQLL
jgi:hypothetical protein